MTKTFLFNGTGLFRPVPSLIFARISLTLSAVFVLGLFFPSHPRLFREPHFSPHSPLNRPGDAGDVAGELSAMSAGDELTFGVTEIESEEPLGAELNEGEGNKRKFGSFVIVNEEMSSFVLQLVFANGSVLKHENGRSTGGVRLENLELRYKDYPLGRDIVRKLSDGRYNGDDFVYEIEFLPEHCQPRYEIELWGAPNWVDGKRAGRGVYREEITFGIEMRP